MEMRSLGSPGLRVSALGLGCMGMSEFYEGRDEAEAIATLERAVELGVTFLDTADMYGSGANEELLRPFIRRHRERLVIGTKFGVLRGPGGSFRGLSGRPDYVRAACDASLARLGVDVIDLYYQHRLDKDVPVEETVGAMADLVAAGKVRFLGLSGASAETVRRAHAVHPISALQSEYSLWTRDPEAEILPVLRELGIGFVPYSPLGRGFLTGRLRSTQDLAENDWRRGNPRFQAETMERNLPLVRRLEEVAADKRCTLAQLTLAWVLAQGDDVVPIPGTKRRAFLEDNVGSLQVSLDAAEFALIDEIMPHGAAVGALH
jgi:aryl-alcohol dehydrogenase-like predicted oxidoreductase